MRILLIGEFSGFHYNLKRGLEDIGEDVILASNGDNFRNYSRDINFLFTSKNLIEKIVKQISPLKYLPKFKNFDVVQFINPKIFSDRLAMNKLMINQIIKQNNRIFLSATGSDAVFWHIGKQKLLYNPLDDWKEIDNKGKVEYIETEEALLWNIKLVQKVHGIIPSMYEYKLGYQQFLNLRNIIPIPFDVNTLPFSENRIENKIVILHGISRAGFKGSKHIIQAMLKIRDLYPNDIELRFPQQLSYHDYLKEVMHANIVIDQANSYSWGINAILAMALGKIVLSGCEPLTLDAFRLKEAPIINIKPDPEKIFNIIENVLANKNQILDISYKSREFVIEFHNPNKIANLYLKQWNC